MPFGFEPYDNKPNMNYSRLQTVSVIANFNREGKIMPVYLSLTDKYDNICNTKIDGVKYTKDNLVESISYICAYTVGSQKRELILTYHINDHIWVLS